MFFVFFCTFPWAFLSTLIVSSAVPSKGQGHLLSCCGQLKKLRTDELTDGQGVSKNRMSIKSLKIHYRGKAKTFNYHVITCMCHVKPCMCHVTTFICVDFIYNFDIAWSHLSGNVAHKIFCFLFYLTRKLLVKNMSPCVLPKAN